MFLRRAKSTRDGGGARARAQIPDFDLHDGVAEVTGNANRLSRLARRKSFTSLRTSRDSRLMLGLPTQVEFDAPKSATISTPSEKKRRSSMFFGPPKATSTPEKRRRPVISPPVQSHLSAFPPRTTSRVQRTPTPVDSLLDESVGLAVSGEEEEPYMIGMALGTPSGVGSNLGPASANVSLVNIVTQKSPSFVLPPTPFGVPATKKLVIEPLEDMGNGGGGWRRFFGRFGKKNAERSRGPTPEPSVYKPPKTKRFGTVKRDGRRQTKPSSPTPCLDVTIPSVEMERYSVMFGTLLQPSEKSSLFARRRSRDASIANSPIEENQETPVLPSEPLPPAPKPEPIVAAPPPQFNASPGLKRNATTGQVYQRSPYLSTNSPVRSRSPLAMLGDNLKRTSMELQRSANSSPSASPGLARSKTLSAIDSPSQIREQRRLSPSSPPAPPPAVPTEVELSQAASAETAPVDSPPTSLSSPAPSPLRSSSRISRVSRISEESASIDTPRGSFDAGDDKWLTTTTSHQMSEGENWEMVTRPTTGDSDITTAAQISIARQISVSQRQLLIPVVPKSQRLVSRRPLKEPMKAKIVEHRLSRAPKAPESAVFATAE